MEALEFLCLKHSCALLALCNGLCCFLDPLKRLSEIGVISEYLIQLLLELLLLLKRQVYLLLTLCLKEPLEVEQALATI